MSGTIRVWQRELGVLMPPLAPRRPVETMPLAMVWTRAAPWRHQSASSTALQRIAPLLARWGFLWALGAACHYVRMIEQVCLTVTHCSTKNNSCECERCSTVLASPRMAFSVLP